MSDKWPDDLPRTKPARRFQGRAVGAVLTRVVGPVMRRRGFRDIDIWEHWPAIVGPELAGLSLPERISRRGPDGAVLTVRVEGAMAIEVQHLSPLILERINQHYGAGSIAKLNIVQGPLPMAMQRSQTLMPNNEERAEAEQDLSDFPQTPLKDALVKLGARVKAHMRRDID